MKSFYFSFFIFIFIFVETISGIHSVDHAFQQTSHHIQGIRATSQTDLLSLGQCEPFDDYPSICSAFLSSGPFSQVWTAPALGLTQEFFAAQGYQPVSLSPTQATSPFQLSSSMPYACAYNYLALMCPTFLRPCAADFPVSLTETANIPLNLCRSGCIMANDACAAFWTNLGLPPLNCSREDPLTGGVLYPPDASSFAPPCVPLPVPIEIPAEFELSCPPPLEFVHPSQGEDLFTGLPCALPCHKAIRLSTREEHAYDARFITYSVLNWLSFIGSIVTVCVYLAIPLLRTYPFRIAIYIGLGFILFHMGFIGNSFIGISDLSCEDRYTIQVHGWCKANIFLALGTSMFSSFWWIFQAFLLFWSIGLLKAQDVSGHDWLEIPYLLIALIYSITIGLVLTFLPLFDGTGGTVTGLPYCGFTPYRVCFILFYFFSIKFYILDLF